MQNPTMTDRYVNPTANHRLWVVRVRHNSPDNKSAKRNKPNQNLQKQTILIWKQKLRRVLKYMPELILENFGRFQQALYSANCNASNRNTAWNMIFTAHAKQHLTIMICKNNIINQPKKQSKTCTKNTKGNKLICKQSLICSTN